MIGKGAMKLKGISDRKIKMAREHLKGYSTLSASLQRNENSNEYFEE